MSYLGHLKSNDVIRLLADPLKSGVLSLRESDGRIIGRTTPAWDTPWVHVKNSYQVNCWFWKQIIFDHIVCKQLSEGNRFVPMGCQDCYKVVARPKTVRQLFALEALQERLKHPSKCGIEIRPEVFGNYGGYFYNRGLPAGVECYKKVRQAVDEDPELGSEILVLLKRGCTEMEMGVGPSDKWHISPEQETFETRLSQLFVTDVQVIKQSDHAKDAVRHKWLLRAWDIGDETAKEYNDDLPFFPPYVTYHHLADEKIDATEFNEETDTKDELARCQNNYKIMKDKTYTI